MPLYEYVCDQCETRFESLRPAARMDDPAQCPGGHARSHRVLSNFAAMSKDPFGASAPVSGMGGCGGGCENCSCSAN